MNRNGNGRPQVITSPLLDAIKAVLPENDKTLLEAEANPNVVPLEVMEDYAAFFLSFRPQIPARADEFGDVASREEMLNGIAPFWCEEKFVPSGYYPNGYRCHSLVEAASTGSIEIFDMLLRHGIDASFWMRPHFYLPVHPKESALCISSPIHAAVASYQHNMLRHLLALGFDPNTLPLANPTRCMTPLAATFARWGGFNQTAFEILASQPSITVDLRNPVYDVHVLHFAVARHNFSALQAVAEIVPLKNAGVTVSGHKLLYIVCFPANSTEFSDTPKKPVPISMKHGIHHMPPIHMLISTSIPLILSWPPPFHVRRFREQNQIIKYLWGSGVRDIAAKDIHGNPALHYLAGRKVVNLGILEWLFEQDPSIGELWNGDTGEDEWHPSPKDLAMDGERAQRPVGELPAESWKIWFEIDRRKDRERRKERVWKGILGERARRSIGED